MRPRSLKQGQRGAALLFALAATVILLAFSFGLTTFVSGHYSLSNTQRYAESALQMADGALHWELNKMSKREYDGSITVDNFGAPYAGGLPFPTGTIAISIGVSSPTTTGAPGSVAVEVSSLAGDAAWIAPNDFRITARGSANTPGGTSVLREVVATGAATTPFDLYSLYGVTSLDLGNGLTTTDARHIGGAVSLRVAGTPVASSTFMLERLGGTQATWFSGAPAGIDWLQPPLEMMLPTASEMVQRMSTRLGQTVVGDAAAHVAANNDNQTHVYFRDSNNGNALTPVVWPAGNTGTVLNSSVWTENNADVIVLAGRNDALNGSRRGSVFYFEEIDIPANKTLEIQNGYEGNVAYGPVRIVVGPTGASVGGVISLQHGTLLVHYRDTNHTDTVDRDGFVLYNTTALPVQINASMTSGNYAGTVSGVLGSFYSYNVVNGSRIGTITLTGNLEIRGSMIANTLNHNGGSLIVNQPLRLDSSGKPEHAATDPARFVLFYRLGGFLNGLYEERSRWSASPAER